MSHFVKFIEKMFWGLFGLGLSLVVFFAVLHVLKNQGGTVPIVGGPLASGANWVGAHAQNY